MGGEPSRGSLAEFADQIFAMVSFRSVRQKPTGDTADLKALTALQILMGEPNDESVSYTKTSALQVSFMLT